MIFALVLNDADRDQELTSRWPRVNDWIMVRQEAPSWIERHSYLAGFRGQSLRELIRASRDTTAWYRALYSDENRDGWMSTRASLASDQGETAGSGEYHSASRCGPFWWASNPAGTYPFEAAHAQIRKGVERSGIPFVDLLPALKGRDSASLWVHPSDLHPNEIAQGLVAPVLAEFAHHRLQEAANQPTCGKIGGLPAPFRGGIPAGGNKSWRDAARSQAKNR